MDKSSLCVPPVADELVYCINVRESNLGFLASRWSDQPSDRLVRRRVHLGSVCSPAAQAGQRVGVALSEAEQVGTMRGFPVIADGAGR